MTNGIEYLTEMTRRLRKDVVTMIHLAGGC
jgi:hypothetical protein